MSLKAFHLIFVTLLTTLSLGLAVWEFVSYSSPQGSAGNLWAGIGAAGAAVLVVFYGNYFLKKLKHVSYL